MGRHTTWRGGWLVGLLLGCGSPPPRPPAPVAVAYAPPPAGAGGAAARAPWQVALPALPSDVAPRLLTPRPARARAAVARPGADSSVALVPVDGDVASVAFGELGVPGEMFGGYGLVGVGAEATGTIGVGSAPRREGLGSPGVLGRGRAPRRVQVSKPVASGGLDADFVRRMLLRAAPSLAACFADQPATFDATGVIAGDGSLQASGGAAAAPAATGCVVAALEAIVFPATGAPTRFTVRLSFRP